MAARYLFPAPQRSHTPTQHWKLLCSHGVLSKNIRALVLELNITPELHMTMKEDVARALVEGQLRGAGLCTSPEVGNPGSVGSGGDNNDEAAVCQTHLTSL